MSTLDDGHGVEVGTIGREGMVGLPLVLGGGSLPFRVFCQVPGRARRVAAAALLAEVAGAARSGPRSTATPRRSWSRPPRPAPATGTTRSTGAARAGC